MSNIVLTRDNLHALSNSPKKHGFNRRQLELFGISWPPRKGWLSGLIGRTISAEKYSEILDAGKKGGAIETEENVPQKDPEIIIRPDEFLPAVPRTIKRPADYTLDLAVDALETQLGTIEAYNRLVQACEAMREKIDAGKAKEQHAMFRTEIGYAKD